MVRLFYYKMKSQLKRGQFSLSEQEVTQLLMNTQGFRDRVILKCLYFGGMRVSEVAGLRVENINFERKTIQIFGKGKKTRVIPFIDLNFYLDLKQFVGERKQGDVFDVKKRMIQIICQRAGEEAKLSNPCSELKHINAHLLRHSIARYLKAHGYPMEFVQNFLGHSQMATTSDTYGTIGLHEMQMIIAAKKQDDNLLPMIK